MKLKIGNHSFDVDLEQNETATALVKLLPMSITMSELNGNEKYYYLSESLPTKPQKPKQIKVGDIMLWGNDCLVVFYKSFSTPYSYTKIGHIKNTEDLQSAVGKSSIAIKWLAD